MPPSPLQIDLLYRTALPARWAALVQIARTAGALAGLGVPVRLGLARVPADPTRALTQLGVTQHNATPPLPLTAARLFPPTLRGRPLPAAFLRRRLRHWLDEADPNLRHAVIVRGESGVRVGQAWPGGHERVVRVFEAHRLVFAEAYEQRCGRAWRSGAPLSRHEQRLKQREAAALAAAHAHAFVSPGIRDAVHAEFGIHRPHAVIPSGVDPPARDADRPLAQRPRDFLYAGKLGAKKGVGTVVRALAAVPGRTLDLYGGSADQVAALQRLAVRHRVADRITFHGHVAPPVIAAALLRTKVALCPIDPAASIVSAAFSSPMKLIEALAAGAAVVASDARPVRDTLAGQPLAHLVAAGDPHAWSQAMQRAVRRADADDRADAQALAHALARTHAWPRRAAALCQLIDQVAEDRPASCRPNAATPRTPAPPAGSSPPFPRRPPPA